MLSEKRAKLQTANTQVHSTTACHCGGSQLSLDLKSLRQEVERKLCSEKLWPHSQLVRTSERFSWKTRGLHCSLVTRFPKPFALLSKRLCVVITRGALTSAPVFNLLFISDL